MKRVLFGLLLIPLLDALFLVVVASELGAVLTVALVVLTALVGTLFVRAEGRHTIRKLQKAAAEGRVPTDELTDGALLIAAGAFLLTPGLVTDTVGFLLAFPPSRILAREAVQKWVVKPYLEKKTNGFATGNVYTFGFPNAEDVGASGTTAGGASAGGASAGGTGAGGTGAGGTGAGGTGAGGTGAGGTGAGTASAGASGTTAGSRSQSDTPDDTYRVDDDAYDIESEEREDDEKET